MMIETRPTKRGVIEILPKFIVKKSSDLMIRGGDFYAIWVEELGLWSIDEYDALQLIDQKLDEYAKENRNKFDANVHVLHMWDASSGMIDAWHKYCQRQMKDSYHPLDEKLIFANSPTNKKDYASKRLPYALGPGDISAYSRLLSVLYSEEERHKIEWAIGSIVSGDSKKLQKFMVFYGAAGTGKSTIINIIQQLFEGYYTVFDAKALGSSSADFALESFRTNPLVAIQHDGDLSKIEDNTRLNSLVSHELMTVNEKFKSTYTNNFKCFLFLGTNRPVKITDSKSGLVRRLIDVTPTGDKLQVREYNNLVKQVGFELGAIASHCKDVFLKNPNAYDDYIPINMMSASNDFYNYIVELYHTFKDDDGLTLKIAWEIYKVYCEDTKVQYPHSQRIFKEELKTYFDDYFDRYSFDDGTRVRSYYKGFKVQRIDPSLIEKESKPVRNETKKIKLEEIPSLLDSVCASDLAQYASSNDIPTTAWNKVKTKLKDIDTSRVHYVKIPENHIVIDFDLSDSDGNKSLEKSLVAANKWPATYTEVSKGGNGLHLHYIYNGDVTKLSRVYDDHIEIKVFTGNSSLRRRLSKCNDIPIATISSGLPLKGDGKVLHQEIIKNEKGIRSMIERNLGKLSHPGTKSSVDFIYKILEDAYNSGIKYDVSDMRNDVLAFAANSTHQSAYCINLVGKMQFKSADISENSEAFNVETDGLIFYDVEVFPNLFICNWKIRGKGKPVVRMINPKPKDIEELIRYPLVGFNCRKYDNHILHARLMGFSNEALYTLSQSIINDGVGFFGEAYNLSYTDVYDFASAANKKSLKKWEIELGLHHQELGLPWDEPVDESLWVTVAEYCDNDVIATEAVFDHLSGDWVARQILADIAGMTVNDTTNTLTTRIVFNGDKNARDQLNYRDLSQPVQWDPDIPRRYGKDRKFRVFDQDGLPTYQDYTPGEKLKPGYSIMPFFPGYTFDKFAKQSLYMGEEIGEGGRVYAEPGIHVNVGLLDIASQHPTSMEEEVLFGPVYTKRFSEIKKARIFIKHKDYDSAKKMLDGKLAKYLNDDTFTPGDLANALKTAINSAYGLTPASFENAFRDPRNIDNIVAKRGALFMTRLKKEVQDRGFTVAHIKTDSIKIPNATPEIIDFVNKFAKEYGYDFEHEAMYSKMCLVNDAVYIARYATPEMCNSAYGYVPGDCNKHGGEWTATGTQFAVPYVFKTLFSKEDILFEDLCETKSVKTFLALDMNENLPDVTAAEKEKFNLQKKLYDFKKPVFSVDAAKILERIDQLDPIITKGHDYHFVGRVGNFCPIRPGAGGGLLMRSAISPKSKEKVFAAATGSKGYRWLEAEFVKNEHRMKDIDKSYYDRLVNDTVETISQHGDFEWFVSDDIVPLGPVTANGFEKCPLYNKMSKDDKSSGGCSRCKYYKDPKDPLALVCAKGYDILPF